MFNPLHFWIVLRNHYVHYICSLYHFSIQWLVVKPYSPCKLIPWSLVIWLHREWCVPLQGMSYVFTCNLCTICVPICPGQPNSGDYHNRCNPRYYWDIYLQFYRRNNHIIYTAHKKFMNGFACRGFDPCVAIISTSRCQKTSVCKSAK